MKLRTWIRKYQEDGNVVDATRLLKWFERRRGIGYSDVAKKIRKQIKDLVHNYSITIIYVTHDHHEAFNLADEIVVINEGKIEETGTPETLKKSENSFLKGFIEL